jgi:hypothetical protein
MNCAAMVWRWLTVIVVRKGLDMAWYIDGSASMGNLDVFARDYRVCMVDCDDETVSESDHEANARLIAAAPDLLDALELARDRLEVCNHEGEEDEALAQIGAAIAKAKGSGR